MKKTTVYNKNMSKEKTLSLPDFFKPLFWFCDFDSLDLEKHKKTIISATLNYGDLKHWRWIGDYYKNRLPKIINEIPATAFRKEARRLAELLIHDVAFINV
ncbi:hypothetical protein A3D55_01040 [Candidatus Jorgensenbacteria bacterium RIFCSPHIGHO2_02_FULL_45_20]|uniref:DUF6922 domain-containing protein n=2 Tax=Candidatus Joergenseniibacteriota TaxID=1752739 RepID=A0A1F6BQM1_9BACT|nr:MAG: hypothetical protein UX22_C0028G0011 [Candidatus Jorgensenbacteria bacterium GW2011_GWA2_45_9]OGG39234.1 MAG: hypothetical protein A3D55_01040 [Candidatus Jorgensenbacteria bacterium RIFCSPHIGHO2_02_FULL_45_20]